MSLLSRLSLNNRLVVALVALAVTVLGVLAMGSLKQELTPSVTPPAATVSVDSPGLAPEEMADLVTEPIEQAIRTVQGVTDITSTTSSGSAQITAQWAFGADDDETVRSIRAATDGLTSALPAGTTVEVAVWGTLNTPALIITATSTGDEDAFGQRLSQSVVPSLRGIPGVRDVQLAGVQAHRIVIAPRAADVTRLKIDLSSLGAIVKAHEDATPAGQAPSADGTVSITVGSASASVDDIAALVVPTADGAVLVSDFADVSVETVPATTIARMNGRTMQTLKIFPTNDANLVDLSHAVNGELDRVAPGLGAQFVAVLDKAPYIEQSVHDLSVEGGLGLLFAVLVILAFLRSWRSTVIAAISIPLSLLITLIGLWWSGYSLNILSLGALTIAVGRVVDDSIVVIENITRRRGTGPLTPEMVVASVRQVAGAISASTLTTVAVFLPIAFVSGVTGQLFRPFAVTMTIALLASLVVALTIVPVCAYWFLQRVAARPAEVTPDVTAVIPTTAADEDEVTTRPDRLHRAVMPALASTRRHPVVSIAVAAVLLIVTVGMAASLPTDFLGSSGRGSLQVTQTPPGGGDPVAAAEPVERALEGVAGVKAVLTTVPLAAGGEADALTYDLLLDDDADTTAVQTAVQGVLDGMTDAGRLAIASQDAVAGDGAESVLLRIQGDDAGALRAASDQLAKELAGADGVSAVTSEIDGEQPVMRVAIDEARAATLGFDRATVASAIRAALEGVTVGSLTLEGQKRDVVVRTAGAAATADTLGDIMLPVTSQQTAEARKAALDALEQKAKEESDRAKADAEKKVDDQIADAAEKRAAYAAQIPELQKQLGALSTAPIEPGQPLTPETEAALRAQQEREQQIAGLREALEGARAGVTGMDEQITSLQQARSDAEKQQEDAEAAAAAQKAAAEVTGTAIPLSAVATVTRELTAPSITRAGGERQVTLTVDADEGRLDAVSDAIHRATSDANLPAGVSFVQDGSLSERDDAFGQLGIAMLAAIMLVLLVMVATFRTFREPLVLLVSIPFAATGAIGALWLTGTPLGLPALIGLLMLIGIVVTNAIVLLDLIRHLRSAGVPLEEAVEQGTRLRLRPILMTAAATVFALIPMSLGLTGGGVFISQPLAVVVIGGLVSSTLLTLVLVPTLYTFVERGRDRRALRRAERRAARAEEHEA
ncbi:MAG: efflux RND transporter permease subunit [Microbacterium enclense]